MKQIQVFGSDGRDKETLAMTFDVEEKPIHERTYAIAVRVLRFSWRQGTVSSKTRSDLAFSNKKPWRQKGTGRARAGSLRSPLWRKGAVLFGPQPRTRTLAIPRQQKRNVMNSLFFSMLNGQRIWCFDLQVDQSKISTKAVMQGFKHKGFDTHKTVLFLAGDDVYMTTALRNAASFGSGARLKKREGQMQVVFYDQPNAVDLSKGANWVFLKKDADLFKKMVEKWN